MVIVEKISISDLKPNPLNRTIDPVKVTAIKQSIEDTGLVKPLVYADILTDEGEQKIVTDGNHRYFALKLIGAEKIPAVKADSRGIQSADFLPQIPVEKILSKFRSASLKLSKEGITSTPVAGLGLTREDLGPEEEDKNGKNRSKKRSNKR